MSIENCLRIISDIVEASRNKLTPEKAKELLFDLERSVQQKRELGVNYTSKDFLEDQTRIIYREKKSANAQAKSLLLNTIVKDNLKKNLLKYNDPYFAIESLLVGSYSQKLGSRSSIGSKMNSMRKELLGSFLLDLNKLDNQNNGIRGETEQIFRKGLYSKDIVYELHNLRSKNYSENVSITGNQKAFEIARVIAKHQDYVRERLNRAGADIYELEGRIGKQTHSRKKLINAGANQWINDVTKLLDLKKTFGDSDGNLSADKINEIKNQLTEIYNNLVAGKQLEFQPYHDNSKKNLDKYFTKGSLGSKISESRELHFKGPDEWLQYNEKYGNGSFEKTFLKDMLSAGRDITLIENLGTDPEKMLFGVSNDEEGTVKGIIQILKEDADQRGEYSKSKKADSTYLRNLFYQLTGKSERVENHLALQISNSLLAINYMAKLGGAVITAFNDIPNQVRQLQYLGHNPIEAYVKTFSNLSFNLSPTYKKDIALSIGAGLESRIGGLLSGINLSGDEEPGFITKMTEIFFKLNLLEFWTESHKSGMSLTLSNFLGRQSGTAFEDLDKSLTNSLIQYGISGKEWKAIRQSVSTSEDGNLYLLPENIDKLSSQVIEEYLGKSNLSDITIKREKDKLKTLLSTMVIDSVDEGVITPGIKEKTILSGGLTRGTFWGEFIRHLTQFKQFPVKFVNQMGLNPFDLGNSREFLGKGFDFKEGPEEVLRYLKSPHLLGLTAFMAQIFIFGWITQSLKSIANNETPMTDFSNPKVLTQIALRSGMMGLYGDFLFGEYTKYGGTFLGTLAGPTFQNLTEGSKVAQGLFRSLIFNETEGVKQAQKSTYNLIKNNTPGLNLFYAKLAFDYLLLYNIEEYFNPTYVSRKESRMRETGQDYIIQPR